MKGLDLFYQSHVLRSPNINDERDEIGVCFPPNVYFIPSKIQHRTHWSYVFWHEYSHVDILGTSSIGSLVTFIDEVSKYLIYFISPVLGEKGPENLKVNIERIKDLSITLVENKKILLKYSKICNELYPTTYQIHPQTRLRMLNELISIQNRFFGSHDTKDDIMKFIIDVSNSVQNEFSLGKDKNEHFKAFKIGTEIIDNFPDPHYLYIIASFALNINISDLDVLSSPESFEQKIIENPDRYIPDFRIFKLAEYSVKDLLKEKDENARNYKRTLETILRYIYDKRLPNFLREADTFVLYFPKKNPELMKNSIMKSITEIREVSNEIVTNSVSLCYPSKYGTLFFYLPKQRDANIRLKIFLSQTYCYELLQRLSGLKTYPENILKLFKILLNELDRKIPDKITNHRILEEYLLNNYPKSTIKNVIPIIN